MINTNHCHSTFNLLKPLSISCPCAPHNRAVRLSGQDCCLLQTTQKLKARLNQPNFHRSSLQQTALGCPQIGSRCRQQQPKDQVEPQHLVGLKAGEWHGGHSTDTGFTTTTESAVGLPQVRNDTPLKITNSMLGSHTNVQGLQELKRKSYTAKNWLLLTLQKYKFWGAGKKTFIKAV